MILHDRFAQALTLDEFIQQAVANKDLWIALTRRARAPEDLVQRLAALPAPRHLLVLAEDWCGDAFNTVPWVAALAEAVPALDLRILKRDTHLDVMDAHLSGTSRAIPVVIVLDEQYRELGWWGSRPKPLQTWVTSDAARQMTKEDRYREMRAWYVRDQGRSALEEIVSLLERTARTKAVA